MSISNNPYHRPSNRENYDRELDCFRYADGARIRRGDLVRVPSEGDGRTYRVIGFDTARAAVVALDPLGRRRDIPRELVAREL